MKTYTKLCILTGLIALCAQSQSHAMAAAFVRRCGIAVVPVSIYAGFLIGKKKSEPSIPDVIIPEQDMFIQAKFNMLSHKERVAIAHNIQNFTVSGDCTGCYLPYTQFSNAVRTLKIHESNSGIRHTINLSRADLYQANIAHAHMPNGRFERAILTGANCTRTNLEGANLKFSDLQETDFTGANLARADFTHAETYKTNLTGANIVGAHISKKQLEDCIVCNTLRSRWHGFSSYVDNRDCKKK